MALPDVFNGDLFTLQGLTTAIKHIKYTPSRITEMGLFSARGIDTTSVFIDIGKNSVNLVASTERGATPATVVGDKFESRPFRVLHLPQRSNIMADEVQNIRAFGSEDSTQGVQMKINDLLGKHKRNLALTKENHMFGAIKGQILDADGSTVLLDLHAEMGTTPTSFDMELDVDTTEVRNKVVEMLRVLDDKLDGVPYRSVHVLCGFEFFDELISHPEVKETFKRQSESVNRTDLRRGFEYAGVTFEEYRPGAGVTIEQDEAWAIPMGVDEMFIARYAPADYVETVNTIGIPFYSKSMPMDFDKGVVIETQSNPLHLCTRPNAVIRLGLNAAALA